MILEILTFLIGPGLLIMVGQYLLKRIKANDQKTSAVCLGVQAILRYHLIEAYQHYSEKGYAPIYAKENFENMWTQYHNLGVNGVMDGIHDKFMKLPDRRKEENEN